MGEKIWLTSDRERKESPAIRNREIVQTKAISITSPKALRKLSLDYRPELPGIFY